MSLSTRKFKYQLTHYMKKKELEPFLEPLTKDGMREFYDYEIKERGASGEFAIYTEGKEIRKDYKIHSSSENWGNKLIG